jgi:hypothetical protein
VPLDYSSLDLWAAHPNKTDEADRTPEGDTLANEGLLADVFFIHPTTYTGDRKGQDKWNGPIDDPELNKKTDEGTIRFQASAFNHAGRIFAPRYRQAHLNIYFCKDKVSAKKALDFAYADVRNAFEYYMTHYNHGQPVIIAGHSQGTNHAELLLQEYFDGKPLKNKLVAAYLVGMPVKSTRFYEVLPCRQPDDTGCFVSWRTFKAGYTLPADLAMDSVIVTNPLSWNINEVYMPKSANKGTLLFDFNKLYKGMEDAQVHNDILWANKPKFFGSIFLMTKNYHPADINFYYISIRENAKSRVDKFIQNELINRGQRQY